MKSNNQYNKKPKHLKQVTINLWSACLRRCFFVLLLIFPLLLTEEAQAGFCWAMDGASTCTLQDGNGSIDYYDPHELEPLDGGDQTFTSNANFQFRSGCTADNDCSGGLDWEVHFVNFKHNGSNVDKGKFNDETHYVLDAFFNIRGFGRDDKYLTPWPMDDKFNGGGQDNLRSGEMSGRSDLSLTLKYNLLKDLQPGDHHFTVVLEGRELEKSGVTRTLNYHFFIKVPENKQVRISGLRNVQLGTFPEHSSYDSQNFCIHSSGEGNFKIRAEGGDKRDNNFQLNSASNTISYSPLFGVGNSLPENSLLRMNDETSGQFKGHKDDFCGGGTNMTLAIKLNTTFEELSIKPAGNYTDTLTLHVEAD